MPDQYPPGSPVTADQPTRQQAAYHETPQYQPGRPAAQRAAAPQRVEKLVTRSNAAQWVQSISLALIALMMLVVFLLAGFQALKARAMMQQYQQNCGVNPSTGLIECR